MRKKRSDVMQNTIPEIQPSEANRFRESNQGYWLYPIGYYRVEGVFPLKLPYYAVRVVWLESMKRQQRQYLVRSIGGDGTAWINL